MMRGAIVRNFPSTREAEAQTAFIGNEIRMRAMYGIRLMSDSRERTAQTDSPVPREKPRGTPAPGRDPNAREPREGTADYRGAAAGMLELWWSSYSNTRPVHIPDGVTSVLVVDERG